VGGRGEGCHGEELRLEGGRCEHFRQAHDVAAIVKCPNGLQQEFRSTGAIGIGRGVVGL
jgi:hypothetical protein